MWFLYKIIFTIIKIFDLPDIINCSSLIYFPLVSVMAIGSSVAMYHISLTSNLSPHSTALHWHRLPYRKGKHTTSTYSNIRAHTEAHLHILKHTCTYSNIRAHTHILTVIHSLSYLGDNDVQIILF